MESDPIFGTRHSRSTVVSRLKGVPARSTLADALNGRDWCIHEALAFNLMARALYANSPINAAVDQSVYPLDATTIDLCLSSFEWAPFRQTKAAIKLHTLLDLRGAIPSVAVPSNLRQYVSFRT